MKQGETLHLLDLRVPSDFNDEHIAGSVNLPLEEFDASAFVSEQKIRPVYLICGTGKRAYQAAEELYKKDFRDVIVLAGGLLSWRVQGFPLAGKKH